MALRCASEATREESTCIVLDVGLVYEPRLKSDFSSLQKLFGLLYKLACIICTEQAIDLQYDNDVDFRFFLFHLQVNRGPLQPHDADPRETISLKQVARSRRSWGRICTLESESGEELLQTFLRLRAELKPSSTPDLRISRLPGGLSTVTPTALAQELEALPTTAGSKPRSVAVGGTFDHLHAGHKLLLTMTALALSPSVRLDMTETVRLTIGITGDELLKKKQYLEELEDWDQRQAAVKAFLVDFLEFTPPGHVLQTTDRRAVPNSQAREVIDRFQSGLEVRYSEIFDPFGPTIADANISALIISAETRAGGDAVNQKRQEKNWSPLEVLEVDVLDTEDNTRSKSSTVPSDFHNKLSSTEIRSRIHKKRIMALESG